MRFDLTVNEFTKELALEQELVIFGSNSASLLPCGGFISFRVEVLNADADKVAFNVFNVGSTDENYQKKMIVDERKVLPNAQIKYVQKQEDPRVTESILTDQPVLNFKIPKPYPKAFSKFCKWCKTVLLLIPMTNDTKRIVTCRRWAM